MAQSELRRRIKQRDTLLVMLKQAEEEHDVERYERIRASIGETEALLERLQQEAQSDESGEGRRRRR